MEIKKRALVSSKNNALMKEVLTLGLDNHQTKYIFMMVNIIKEVAHLHFDPGKENPSFLQYSYPLPGWGEYAKYNALSLEEQQKCDLEVRECWGSLKGIIQLVSCNGDTTISQFVKDYVMPSESSLFFPAGTVITTVKRYIFPYTPEMEEDCKELLDPDNYGYSHVALDFVNEKLNEEFPGRNLWAVTLDFDGLEIIDMNKMPHFIRY